jgi:hypothetical protein
MTTATPYALAVRLSVEAQLLLFHSRFATLELLGFTAVDLNRGTGWIFTAFEEQGLMRPRRKE